METLESCRLSVTDRYYTKRYFFDKKGKNGVCIMTHSNRLFIITLPQDHPIVKDQLLVRSINYKVDGTDRASNPISGKGKRKAQVLKPSSLICRILCQNEEEYDIICGVEGKLLEINENLATNPELLCRKPNSEGYIAIVLPYLNTYDSIMNSLLSEEEYKSKLDQSVK